ncbi:MAG: peptide chain release factor N(5)-glutamine methyltransferase [Clostridiales bacterium]|nr:peptide chain release factor N(5)-glutamine methyltransferase [Clostridiales bacterium]
MRTYYDIYSEARARLRKAGIGEYSLEARLLLAFAANKTPTDFYRDISMYCTEEYEREALILVSRRENGEPVAYLTGSWEFYGLPVTLTPDVLIPRADTETLVEAVLEELAATDSPRVLDLCCGSGCIGLAIAKNARGAPRVVCADISQKALRIAAGNAADNGIKTPFLCVRADALSAPPPNLGMFDAIMCNPPYIPTPELEGLDASVKDYEPMLALDGGPDGLDFYRPVCSMWTSLLKPGGLLAFECAEGQSGDIIRIAENTGLRHVKTVKDTGNTERAILFTK